MKNTTSTDYADISRTVRAGRPPSDSVSAASGSPPDLLVKVNKVLSRLVEGALPMVGHTQSPGAPGDFCSLSSTILQSLAARPLSYLCVDLSEDPHWLVSLLVSSGPTDISGARLKLRAITTPIPHSEDLRPHISVGSFWYYPVSDTAKLSLTLLRSYTLLLEELFADFWVKFSHFDLRPLFRKTISWSLENFVPYVKYMTVFPQAYLQTLEFDSEFGGEPFLPSRPDGFVGHIFPFSRNLQQFLWNRLHCGRYISRQLALGLLQGVKRAICRVPNCFVKKTLIDHQLVVGTPEKPPEPSVLPDTDSVQDCCVSIIAMLSTPRRIDLDGYIHIQETEDDEISSVVEPSKVHSFSKTVLHMETHCPFTKSPVLQPSLSAHQGSTRKNMGAYGEIWKPDEASPIGLVAESGPFAQTRQILLPSDFGEDFEIPSDGCMVETVDVIKHLLKRPLPSRPFKCRVVAICEPLKVRTITAGESLPYYFSKYVQRSFKKDIDRFPQFALTNEPFEVKHLEWLWGMTKLTFARPQTQPLSSDCTRFDFRQTGFWVSGDYKGATDHVRMSLTMQTFRHWISSFPLSPRFTDEEKSKLQEAFEGTIGPQEMIYPDGTSVLQQNGQLMGSVLSFPILCVINVACYAAALEEYRVKYPTRVFTEVYLPGGLLNLASLPVLVNGDDVSFFCPDEEFYETWSRKVSSAGFKKSLGKNYRSRQFVTINSKMFLVIPMKKDLLGHHTSRVISQSSIDLSDDGSTVTGSTITERHLPMKSIDYYFVEVPYLNVGLLVGQTKLSDQKEDLPIWDIHTEVMHGSANSKVQTHQRFLYYQKELIEKLTDGGRLNLFVSRELGGLGFKPVGDSFRQSDGTYRLEDGAKFFLTLFQRKLATFRGQLLDPRNNIFFPSPPLRAKIPCVKFSAKVDLREDLIDGSVIINRGISRWVHYSARREVEILVDTPATKSLVQMAPTGDLIYEMIPLNHLRHVEDSDAFPLSRVWKANRILSYSSDYSLVGVECRLGDKVSRDFFAVLELGQRLVPDQMVRKRRWADASTIKEVGSPRTEGCEEQRDELRSCYSQDSLFASEEEEEEVFPTPEADDWSRFYDWDLYPEYRLPCSVDRSFQHPSDGCDDSGLASSSDRA